MARRLNPEIAAHFPSQLDIERQLLRRLWLSGKPTRPRDLYVLLADDLELTAEQRALKLRDRDASAWHHAVQFARWGLVKELLLDPSRHGYWFLTEAGRARAVLLDTPVNRPEDVGL